MRIRTVATVVACALVVVAAGAIVANAGSDITSPETITALGTQTKFRYFDNGKPGFSSGDVNMFTERLTDGSDAAIGSARVTCTVQIGQWAMCEGAFTIKGRGEIIGSGLVDIGEESTGTVVPITGGTGDFANVRGEDQIEFLSDNEEMHTLNLLPQEHPPDRDFVAAELLRYRGDAGDTLAHVIDLLTVCPEGPDPGGGRRGRSVTVPSASRADPAVALPEPEATGDKGEEADVRAVHLHRHAPAP